MDLQGREECKSGKIQSKTCHEMLKTKAWNGVYYDEVFAPIARILFECLFHSQPTRDGKFTKWA